MNPRQDSNFAFELNLNAKIVPTHCFVGSIDEMIAEAGSNEAVGTFPILSLLLLLFLEGRYDEVLAEFDQQYINSLNGPNAEEVGNRSAALQAISIVYEQARKEVLEETPTEDRMTATAALDQIGVMLSEFAITG